MCAMTANIGDRRHMLAKFLYVFLLHFVSYVSPTDTKSMSYSYVYNLSLYGYLICASTWNIFFSSSPSGTYPRLSLYLSTLFTANLGPQDLCGVIANFI